MAYTYAQALGIGFPTVQFHSPGSGAIYEDLVWDGGAELPSKITLDTWISANPQGEEGIIVTRYEFRQLFTFSERVAIDNIASNVSIPANYKAMIITMLKDLEVSSVVQLTTNPDVTAGVNLLESLGLIGSGRASSILSNIKPL
jgi:hypothetical protein